MTITFPIGINEGTGFASAAFENINSMLFSAQKNSGGQVLLQLLLSPQVKYGRASNQNVATVTNVGEFAPMVILKGYTL